MYFTVQILISQTRCFYPIINLLSCVIYLLLLFSFLVLVDSFVFFTFFNSLSVYRSNNGLSGVTDPN